MQFGGISLEINYGKTDYNITYFLDNNVPTSTQDWQDALEFAKSHSGQREDEGALNSLLRVLESGYNASKAALNLDSKGINYTWLKSTPLPYKILSVGNDSLSSIMQTLEPIIKKEFDEGRISEQQWANVYLGALQLAMQQAYSIAERENAMEFQNAQVTEMQQSVMDNRLIKSAEQLSNIVGMGLGGSQVIPTNLYTHIFNIIGTLLSGGTARGD